MNRQILIIKKWSCIGFNDTTPKKSFIQQTILKDNFLLEKGSF